ncbi:TniQ family protein [Rhodococcus sp. USK10]|nr:TniQ family protein [Rhodococcus sp. USK10]
MLIIFGSPASTQRCRPIDGAGAKALAAPQDRHRFSESRFCPRCLADPDCIWQMEWAYPLLPICLRHRLRLQTRCPGCGQVPFSDTTWLASHGQPWHCPQRGPRGTDDRRVRPFCRHDLRDAATIDANETGVPLSEDIVNTL